MGMTLNEIEKRVIDIIAEVSGYPIEKINLDTTINIEIGIYGDDWNDLLNAYLKVFDVDFTEFNVNKHIRPEGDPILQSLIDFLIVTPIKLMLFALLYFVNRKLSKKFSKIPDYEEQPLYVGDLVMSTYKGKWTYYNDEQP